MKLLNEFKINTRGFTLIEMIVVVAVISILMTASIDMFSNMYSLSMRTNDSRIATQEARYALDTISREVRESSSFTPTSVPGTNSSTIDIVNKQGQKVRFGFGCTNNCNTSDEFGRITMDVTNVDNTHQPLEYLTTDKVEVTLFYVRPIEISSETDGINSRSTVSGGNVYHPFSNLRITVRGKIADRTGQKPSVSLDTAMTRNIYSDYNYCDLFSCNNYTLTVVRAGSAGGSVSSDPPGISDSSPSIIFKDGETINVTAFAYPGAAIWSGCDSVAGSVCSINMNSDKVVTVTFNPPPQRNLTIAYSGAGTGTTSSNPAGTSFTHGTTVQVTATPASNSAFVSWSGCNATSSNVCTVVMDSDKTITVNFAQKLVRFFPRRLGGTGTGKITLCVSGDSCITNTITSSWTQMSSTRSYSSCRTATVTLEVYTGNVTWAPSYSMYYPFNTWNISGSGSPGGTITATTKASMCPAYPYREVYFGFYLN